MPTQVPAGEGVPSVFYRNAIDLNRFSNGIARKLAQENVNVIVRAVDQLKKIDESKGPSYKAARLRSLIKQTKKTLSTWQEKSVDVMIKDLESVAKVQAGFVEDQLKKALPAGMQKQIVEEIGYSVQSVAVSPGFAKAVVTNTPTKFNLGQAGKFNLTAKQGAEVLLPNGETISKAFRGLAAKQANQFNQIVRTGLLSGEPTPDIVRQLVGNLDFGEKAKTIKQLNMAGGEVTKLATHQINTIVRTSVNQVSNAASQSVYKANKKITKEYRYISTLDSRTSAVCRNLDGQIFLYGKGPEPPQHFGCRSTTVPVIDYKGNGWPAPPSVTTAKRASVDGPVPAKTTYGKWLYDNRKSGTKFTPGPEQVKALGKEKAKYFNRLASKYGPDQAMAKFMREDGSEVTLKKLESRYGKPEDIKAKVKIKPPSKALIAKEGKYMTKAEKAGTVKYKPLTAEQKKLIDKSIEETKFKKSVQDVVPDVATFAKLPKGEQSTIKFLDDLKLNSEAEQKYWKSAKAFNSQLIPKDQFKTITPKQLARRIEDDKISKLQKKFDNKAKKALQPKKEIKRDNRKWNDPSFLDKKLAGESSTSAIRKTSGLGKKKSEDLMFKPKPEEVGLTRAKFRQTEETIGQWAGSDYMQLRGVQLDQAQAVGAQLNPAQIKHLKRYKEIRARTENVRNQWGRYADQMEDYISKAPKWKGKPQALLAGQKELDGTIFRGIGFQDKRVVESIVESYKRGDAGLTMESWTANRRIASGFSADTHSVMIKQVNKHGTSIEPWNGLGEKEIVQPRGVRYKVLSAETKEWVEEGVERSFTEITLEAY